MNRSEGRGGRWKWAARGTEGNRIRLMIEAVRRDSLTKKRGLSRSHAIRVSGWCENCRLLPSPEGGRLMLSCCEAKLSFGSEPYCATRRRATIVETCANLSQVEQIVDPEGAHKRWVPSIRDVVPRVDEIQNCRFADASCNEA